MQGGAEVTTAFRRVGETQTAGGYTCWKVQAGGLVVLGLFAGLAAGACGAGLGTGSVGPRPTTLETASPIPSITVLPSSSLKPQSGSFGGTGSMLDGRERAAAALLEDGRVLVVGGIHAERTFRSAEVYEPATGAFSIAGSMLVARWQPTATLLRDGRVLVAGGRDGDEAPWAEIFDPATGEFSAAGVIVTDRDYYTASLLPDGRVLFAGGYGEWLLASAETFDPETGTFSPTGSMRDARQGHTATVLADGRVLVAGGEQGEVNGVPVFLRSAEIYDPATGKWTPTGSLLLGRTEATASLLPDGRVLVAGGQGWQPIGPGQEEYSTFESAEIYDPATGEWTSAGSMQHPRWLHTATSLADGRVLIAGGVDGLDPDPLNAVEVFDPTTGDFTPTRSMRDGREQATATLLADGRVLMAGGDPTDPTYCELYWP
jgi:hypothetical protein